MEHIAKFQIIKGYAEANKKGYLQRDPKILLKCSKEDCLRTTTHGICTFEFMEKEYNNTKHSEISIYVKDGMEEIVLKAWNHARKLAGAKDSPF